MKLYFKDLSAETRLTFLEFLLNQNRMKSHDTHIRYEISILKGYVETDDYVDEYAEKIKILNIWKNNDQRN